MSDNYCKNCGETTSSCKCLGPKSFDAPRFCPSCGKKLRILITPSSLEALCKNHGSLEIEKDITTQHYKPR